MVYPVRLHYSAMLLILPAAVPQWSRRGTRVAVIPRDIHGTHRIFGVTHPRDRKLESHSRRFRACIINEILCRCFSGRPSKQRYYGRSRSLVLIYSVPVLLRNVPISICFLVCNTLILTLVWCSSRCGTIVILSSMLWCYPHDLRMGDHTIRNWVLPCYGWHFRL